MAHKKKCRGKYVAARSPQLFAEANKILARSRRQVLAAERDINAGWALIFRLWYPANDNHSIHLCW